jgi:ornithine decarboxylase
MELEKLSRRAPGSKVFCRILTTGHGAVWPLTRKFGCDADMALDLLQKAKELGLVPWGVSFHVGSQQQNPQGWHDSIKLAAWLFKRLEKKGVELDMVNLGGGFPARYMNDLPSLNTYGTAIHASLTQCFGNKLPSTIILEPGRAMVGNAGVLQTEVVLVAEKSRHDSTRWVFLDCGKFGGLNETDDERLLYPITTDHAKNAPTSAVVLAGPTCDSADILYEKNRYQLPTALKAGDRLTFHAAGAYTTTYSTVGFNGFAPLKAYYI